MKSKLLLAAAFAALISPAFAADLSVNKAPVPYAANVNPFQGFYIGASAGFASGDATVRGVDLNPTGFTGGVQGGYNALIGAFLLGVEADAGFTNLSNTSQNVTLGNGFLGDITARAGVTFDHALVYAKGGYAYANASALDSGLNGFVIGGGGEFAVTQHISLKAEYLHYDFGSQTINSKISSTATTADSFKAGVNYHFN